MKLKSDSNNTAGEVAQERLVRHLLDALKRIADLKNATQTRGPLEHTGTPEHMVDQDGWGPIQPAVKTGLCIAARIADRALKSLPNDEMRDRHLEQPTPEKETFK